MCESEVVLTGTLESRVKKGSDGACQLWPVIVSGRERRPITIRVRTAIPITRQEGNTRRIEGRGSEAIKENPTGAALSWGIHVRNRKKTAANTHLSCQNATVRGEGMGRERMARIKEDAHVAGPERWSHPHLSPKMGVLRGSVSFLQADYVRLQGAKIMIELPPALGVTNAVAVKGYNR